MPYGLASRCRLIFHVRAARWIRRSGSKATKNTWGRAATYLGGHQIVTRASGPWWFGEGVRRIPPSDRWRGKRCLMRVMAGLPIRSTMKRLTPDG